MNFARMADQFTEGGQALTAGELRKALSCFAEGACSAAHDNFSASQVFDKLSEIWPLVGRGVFNDFARHLAYYAPTKEACFRLLAFHYASIPDAKMALIATRAWSDLAPSIASSLILLAELFNAVPQFIPAYIVAGELLVSLDNMDEAFSLTKNAVAIDNNGNYSFFSGRLLRTIRMARSKTE